MEMILQFYWESGQEYCHKTLFISLLDWSFLLKIDNLKTIIKAFMKTPKKKMEAKMDEAAGYICDFSCDSGKMCNVYLNF